MIVSDISKDSLQKSRNLLALHQLDERVYFRVADGLNAFEGFEPTFAAICGMGGALTARILKAGQAYLGKAHLVLCSHTDIPLVRETLSEIGYHIDDERIVRAKGRFYIVMRAAPGLQHYQDKELYLGPILLKKPDEMLLKYLQWREGVVSCEQGHDRQLEWIREEIDHVKACLG